MTQTPGPWLYIDATKSAAMKYSQSCVIRAGEKQIASFSWNDRSPWFPTKLESQANARLIAAAPELLEALQGLTLLLSGMPMSGIEAEQLVDRARAVIAKATEA